jgi:hypothetical protein
MGRPKKISRLFSDIRAGDARLSTFMRRHHDDLLRELGSGRIQWRNPLRVFAGLGLTDEHGQPVSREAAARTWLRVRREVAAAREKRAVTAVPVLEPGELAPGVRAIIAAERTANKALPPRSAARVGISPARPRDPTRKSEAADADAPAPLDVGSVASRSAGASVSAGAAEQIQRVLREIGSTRTPLPGRST